MPNNIGRLRRITQEFVIFLAADQIVNGYFSILATCRQIFSVRTEFYTMNRSTINEDTNQFTGRRIPHANRGVTRASREIRAIRMKINSLNECRTKYYTCKNWKNGKALEQMWSIRTWISLEWPAQVTKGTLRSMHHTLPIKSREPVANTFRDELSAKHQIG